MRIAISFLALLGFSFQVGAESSVSSTANCSSSSTGDCFIKWNFTSGPRAHYWIQQYDLEARQWVNLDGPSTDPYGISKSIVPGGFLYRVLGCDDLAGRSNCDTSTVYWVPIRLTSADAIPATMKEPSGGTFTVSKHLDLKTQLVQYNVYLLAQVMGTIGDLSPLPPMTKPPSEEAPSLWTYADTVHINVYPTYYITREMHIAAQKAAESLE